MRVSVKVDWWRFALAALALALLGEAAADFKIADVQPKFTEQSLTFAGNLDLGLSAKVEEALAKGIPLEVVIDVRLYHQRRYLWDKKIASWTLRRRIQYHALSGQYLVSAGEGEAETRESLLTQQEALKQLGSLSDLKLALPDSPSAGVYSADITWSARVRARRKRGKACSPSRKR